MSDSASTDLDDIEERAGFELVSLDLNFFTSPTVLGAVGGVVLGAAALVWPNPTDQVLARLLGVALVLLGLVVLARLLRRNFRSITAAAVGVGCLGVGVFILRRGDHSADSLGRILGVTLLVYAATRLAPRAEGDERSLATRVKAAVAPAAVAALLLAFPADSLAVVTTIGALCWIVLSLIVIVASLDARTANTVGYGGAIGLAREWLTDRPKAVEERQSLYAKILYDGGETRVRIIRFFALMSFASVIASMGVITDSTAVVIGAMLIAPLMTPLMGMAISLAMGWPNRLALSATVALSGIALAITIGVLMGFVAPTVIDTATNSQIIARSSPTMLDLIVAVAAGTAGAYGLSRPDVSDSLPGVAIAISLVPPLTVVGIAYSAGDWSSGNGALLLFTTNALAILVMGGLTFVVTGVTPLAQVAGNQHRVRTSVIAIAVISAIALGSLFLNSDQVASNLFERSSVERVVDDWLDVSPSHGVVDVVIDDDVVTVVVIGPTDGLPEPESLAEALRIELDRAVTTDVRLVVEERFVVEP